MCFIYYNPNPANRSVGDCVVRALSVALNDTWENVYADLTMQGRFMYDMPNANNVWGEYLKINGYKRQAIPDTCPGCYTILRDVIDAGNANTQRIIDRMCQQEIDALKAQNADLRTQINLASLAASQGAQTAQILADNAAQTVALEQYLAPVPRPAYVVQNPNCCQQSFSCGCGM